MGRALSIIAVGIGLAIILIVVALWLSIRGFLQGSGIAPSDRTVYPLQATADGPLPDAILVHSALTGGAPMMVTDPALLSAAREQVFVTASGGLGQAIGSFTLMMMGAPGDTALVSTFHQSALVARHTCPWSRCGEDGRKSADLPLDVSALLGMGQPARLQTETYTDHDAYLAAHAAIAADPSAWFHETGAEIPAPAPDGLDRFNVVLPAVFWETDGDSITPIRTKEPVEQDLSGRLQTALQDTDITLDTITISAFGNAEIGRMDDQPIPVPETGLNLRPLGYVALSPRLTFVAPPGSEPELRRILTGFTNAVPTDATAPEVIAEAAAAAGLSPAGLDFLSHGPREALKITRLPDPFWTLKTVHLTE